MTSLLVRTFFEFGMLKVRSFEPTRGGKLSGKLPILSGEIAYFRNLEPNLARFVPPQRQKHKFVGSNFLNFKFLEVHFLPVRSFLEFVGFKLLTILGGAKVCWFKHTNQPLSDLFNSNKLVLSVPYSQ